MKTSFLKLGMKISAFAVAVAAIIPFTCRGQWYQPEEPKILGKFLDEKQKGE